MSHGGVSQQLLQHWEVEGKKTDSRRVWDRDQVETITHICQSFEAWASCRNGVGGKGVQPQSNLHGSLWNKQAL